MIEKGKQLKSTLRRLVKVNNLSSTDLLACCRSACFLCNKLLCLLMGQEKNSIVGPFSVRGVVSGRSSWVLLLALSLSTKEGSLLPRMDQMFSACSRSSGEASRFPNVDEIGIEALSPTEFEPDPNKTAKRDIAISCCSIYTRSLL